MTERDTPPDRAGYLFQSRVTRDQLHPVVAPQLLHFRQEPFLTIV